jgi:hypothetical protein
MWKCGRGWLGRFCVLQGGTRGMVRGDAGWMTMCALTVSPKASLKTPLVRAMHAGGCEEARGFASPHGVLSRCHGQRLIVRLRLRVRVSVGGGKGAMEHILLWRWPGKYGEGPTAGARTLLLSPGEASGLRHYPPGAFGDEPVGRVTGVAVRWPWDGRCSR